MRTYTDIKIYVASLADYNAGWLTGAWIYLDGKDGDDIRAEVAAMLKTSHEPFAEEWAIHDYELGGIRIGEWEDFDKVAEIAKGLARHGDPYAYYVDNIGLDNSEGFEDAYVGHWDGPGEYAESMYEDTGEDLGPLANYIDWEAVERDWVYNGDIYIIEGEVFRNI